jgi:hypothetical protein
VQFFYQLVIQPGSGSEMIFSGSGHKFVSDPTGFGSTTLMREAERNVQAVSVLTCSPGSGASFFSASQQRALILNTKTFAVERDLAKECEGVFQTIPLCCGRYRNDLFQFRLWKSFGSGSGS